MIYYAEALGASYAVLEVDAVVVALAPAFFQGAVLRILHAYGEVASRYWVLAFWQCRQVCPGKIGEQFLPLFRVAPVLQVEVNGIDAFVRVGGGESLPPLAFFQPSGCLLPQFGVVALVGIDGFQGVEAASFFAPAVTDSDSRQAMSISFFMFVLRLVLICILPQNYNKKLCRQKKRGKSLRD